MLPTRGEKSGRSYLSQEQVDNIRKMRYDGYTYAQIISVYKIPKSTLSNIINHKTWA
jgi:DNA invertase Pin-like site-specific DNA recombinase